MDWNRNDGTRGEPEAIRRRVAACTQALLADDTVAGVRRQAACDLFECLAGLAGLDDDRPSPPALGETWLAGGRAISPRDAAHCLREYARTAGFLRGTRLAMETALGRFPGETLRVLYAGCGPFAPMALLLAPLWPADRVRFTLLDVHAYSLAAARRLARALGVADRIEAWIEADACGYRCAPTARPHLLVTETMQQALRDETQVSICRNLVPQLVPGGLLVPECIELEACLMDPRIDLGAPVQNRRIDLGTIMHLDRENAADGGACGRIAWPVAIPDPWRPFVRTRIRVFGEVVLEDACSLNLPMALPLPDGPRAGNELQFHYAFAPRPGLRADWIPDPAMTTPTAPVPALSTPSRHDRWLRLPLAFDPGPLREEVRRLWREPWAPHPNRADYGGDWRVLALRSPSGEAGDVVAACDDPGAYRDTPALAASPRLAAVIAAMPGRVSSARLLSLAPGAHIEEHRDRALGLWDGMVRLHVPLFTNAAVSFRLAGESLAMGPGECWYINANYPHAVTNGGDEARIHLVVDCVVDDDLVALFLAHGHAPRPAIDFGDPSITPDNVQQVIEGLEALGTPTAREVAERLRARANRLEGEVGAGSS